MEQCKETLDSLMVSGMEDKEWFSALMQIIMTLLVYQTLFAFTHNDLHTNNVMWVPTQKQFLYYKYHNVVYRVPTYGKIFKIIDFGRAIYRFNGNVFCSDSFKDGGDAATQYNTEPYLNPKKPRIDPNFSFDLCRLGCSIFDYVSDSSRNNSPLVRIISEWVEDDKGLNMLYKGDGIERYPDFKLYKMIARAVHKHTPAAQLKRPEFAQYAVNAKHTKVILSGKIPVLDIDAL